MEGRGIGVGGRDGGHRDGVGGGDRDGKGEQGWREEEWGWGKGWGWRRGMDQAGEGGVGRGGGHSARQLAFNPGLPQNPPPPPLQQNRGAIHASPSCAKALPANEGGFVRAEAH